MANTSAWELERDHFRRRKFILCLWYSFDDHSQSYQEKFDFNDVNCLPWQKATVSKITDQNVFIYGSTIVKSCIFHAPLNISLAEPLTWHLLHISFFCVFWVSSSKLQTYWFSRKWKMKPCWRNFKLFFRRDFCEHPVTQEHCFNASTTSAWLNSAIKTCTSYKHFTNA